jgi:hypothetical protein
MKKIAALFFIFISILCFSFSQDGKQHVFYPDKGMDDSLVLKKTKRSEIISMFGKNFTLQYDFTDNGDSSQRNVNRVFQRYPKLGISFIYTAADTNTVVGITVNKLFPAKTDRGVIAGKTTVEMAEALYGIAEWKYTDTSMFKEYPGIAFVIPFNGKFPVSNAVMKASEKKIISQIDIYHAAIDLNR